jgi:DNA-directed RNA polymerase specialized sigma subunit
MQVGYVGLLKAIGNFDPAAAGAGGLGVTGEALREAQRAELAFRPSSLDALLSGEPGGATLADLLGWEDLRLERMLGMRAVAVHWGELPPREQKVLIMRFYGGHDGAVLPRRPGNDECRRRLVPLDDAGGLPGRGP